MRVLTIKKIFSDIPFAHRQPKHDGHCKFLHGHNWGIEVEFGATELDENGFVIDFGKLGFIKDYLKMLDHACVLNADDPLGSLFLNEHKELMPYFSIITVPDCSCEGLAKYLQDMLDHLTKKNTANRVFVRSVTVTEDSKNSARYEI